MENNGAAQTTVETPQPAPAASPELKKLSDHDILRVEHIGLKLQNLQLHEGLLKQQFVSLANDKHRIMKETEELRAELAKKYDINLETHELRPDGFIVPRPTGK